MKATHPKNKTELKKYYAVRYKGKIVSYLSPAFAVRQGVTVEALKHLKDTHRKILKLCDKIRAEEDPDKLKELAAGITDLEFELQKWWNFPKDARFHSWWYRLPKCTCAKMDNRDYLGTGLTVVRHDCPLHGGDLHLSCTVNRATPV